MADAFYAMVTNTSFQYTMEQINTTSLASFAKNRPICKTGTMQPENCIVSTSDIPSILYHTPNVTFDIAITFTYATSDRLAYVDTSIPLVETSYTIMLLPSFAQGGTTLLGTLTRQSIFYIISILFIVSAAMAITFFLSECFLVESSRLLQYRTWSGRLMICFLSATEQVFSLLTYSLHTLSNISGFPAFQPLLIVL